jgi:NADPH2:quinone reductase
MRSALRDDSGFLPIVIIPPPARPPRSPAEVLQEVCRVASGEHRGASAPSVGCRFMTASMRAWRVHEYGQPLDVLRLETVDVPEPEAGEVRVRVQAIPLNLNDLERINGGNMAVRPEFPYSPGMEVMGVVDACGPGTDYWLGARVAAMPKQAYGGYAEYAICPAVSMFALPDDVPLPDAAALYFPFHLAWLGLFDRAALQAGESVLIHAAAGGSGSAAVQLAKWAGARVFATAGTDEKLALCRELGADVAINYTTDDFAEVVLRETEQRGVDVVFDNVGDAVWASSIKCTAYNGRYVMMGAASDKKKVDEPFIVPRQVIAANIKLCGALLAYATPEVAAFVKQAVGYNFASRELGEQIMASILDLVQRGDVRTVIGAVVGFEELPGAIDAMAKRATTGRTIVLV